VKIPIPVMVLPPYGGDPLAWPVSRNVRMRFKGETLVTTGGPTEVSLESAALVLILQNAAYTTIATRLQPARLSNLSALAENAPVSYDDWLIDHNDLLAIPPAQSARLFTLFAYLTLNNTGAAPKGVVLPTTIELAAAQFTDYRFDQWE
jgi:hypothetical protein